MAQTIVKNVSKDIDSTIKDYANMLMSIVGILVRKGIVQIVTDYIFWIIIINAK